MAEATKHNGTLIKDGNLASDIKNLISIIKTRRSVAFAYGFMFAFVAFTVFLAFNPNPNSGSSPWYSNIFSTTSSTSTSTQFSTFFSSLFYHNASSSPSSTSQQFQSSVLSPQPAEPSRSTNATVDDTQLSNQTQPNTLSTPPIVSLVPTNTSTLPIVTNQTQTQTTQTQTQTNPTSSVNNNATVLEANQTAAAAANKTISSSSKPGSSEKGVTSSSYKAVLNKSTNETKASVEVKQGKEDELIKSLLSCDLFHGEWVEDDSYPLYEPGSCPLIDEQFNCVSNGRPDRDYQKFKWKPKDCTLPR